MNHGEIYNLLLQLFVLLAFGRLLAEIARYLNLPPMVGEIIAGIILGKTILGHLYPNFFQHLFPEEGQSSLILDGFVHVSAVLLLFIAGLEVELSIVIQQRKQAFYTSFFGLIIPFGLGFLTPFIFPTFFESSNPTEKILMGIFMGTSMSITALPVIARILMDMNMMRSRFGVLIIASAMMNDLIGWLIFTVVLSMMGRQNELNVFQTIGLTVGFTVFMLTIGKALINMVLPWISRKLAWPGGMITLALAFCFLGAAITERIGIHAVFGAFIFGVALGDSIHFSDKVKEIVHHFINNIFSPLFFVSIGLYIDFISGFNLLLILIILIIAFTGKIIGAGIGSYLGGFTKKESLAIGFGMNARGAMEIILGLIAMEVGLINEQIFIALVIMALVTSISSGPVMKSLLSKSKH